MEVYLIFVNKPRKSIRNSINYPNFYSTDRVSYCSLWKFSRLWSETTSV